MKFLKNDYLRIGGIMKNLNKLTTKQPYKKDIKRNKKYVVQCIKGNNNKFGFGYRHKAGQFVGYSGKGVDLQNAHVYIYGDPENECGLVDQDTDEYKKYYKFVDVDVTTVLYTKE